MGVSSEYAALYRYSPGFCFYFSPISVVAVTTSLSFLFVSLSLHYLYPSLLVNFNILLNLWVSDHWVNDLRLIDATPLYSFLVDISVREGSIFFSVHHLFSNNCNLSYNFSTFSDSLVFLVSGARRDYLTTLSTCIQSMKNEAIYKYEGNLSN